MCPHSLQAYEAAPGSNAPCRSERGPRLGVLEALSNGGEGPSAQDSQVEAYKPRTAKKRPVNLGPIYRVLQNLKLRATSNYRQVTITYHQLHENTPQGKTHTISFDLHQNPSGGGILRPEKRMRRGGCQHSVVGAPVTSVSLWLLEGR